MSGAKPRSLPLVVFGGAVGGDLAEGELASAVTSRQFNDKGHDRISNARVPDTNERSLKPQSLVDQGWIDVSAFPSDLVVFERVMSALVREVEEIIRPNV